MPKLPTVPVLIISAALLVGANVVPRVVMSAWGAEEAAVVKEAEDARKAAAEAREAAESQQAAVVYESTGLDRARIEADEAVIRGMLRTMCTWSSQATYESARQALMRDYGVASESEILTEIMPYVAADSVNGKGEVLVGHNQIDQRGLNMTLGDVTCHLGTMSSDGLCDYVVDFEAISSDGSHLASRNLVLVCSTTPDGGLIDVRMEEK
jgi:hypothetical protein